SFEKPKKPQVPLIVWKARNTFPRRSLDPGSLSSETRSRSSWSRFSRLSARKSLMRSSLSVMRSPHAALVDASRSLEEQLHGVDLHVSLDVLRLDHQPELPRVLRHDLEEGLFALAARHGDGHD